MVELKDQFAYKTATLRAGRFAFNQVVYALAQTTPERVVLIGWDTDRGVFVWSPTANEVAGHASIQATGYSLILPNINPDFPPLWLGPPERLTREQMLEADAWPSLAGLAPHPKRQAILAAVQKLRPDLFA